MSKIQLEPEFVRLLQGIYGDADLDGGTIKKLYETWKANPQYLRTAYQSKQEKPTIAPITPTPIRFNVPTPELKIQKMTIPQKEIAQDDLSGILNFNDAFKVARERNLGYFKWKGTQANPSGIYKVELASSKQSTPAVTQKPVSKSTTQPQVPATSQTPTPTPTSTSPQVSSTQRRGVMSKEYYKKMLDKGFTWDSKKQMWNKPKVTRTSPEVATPQTTQTPTQKPTVKSTQTPVTQSNSTPNTVQATVARHTAQNTVGGDFGIGKAIVKGLGNFVDWLNNGAANNSYNRNKGVMPLSYYQQGGKLEDSQKAFVAYLIQVSGAQSEQELNDFIQSLGEEGLKQQYQQFVQTMQNGTQSAKNGAKLNYIKSLRGQCPEGFELGYFKEGGQICAKCVEKREKMGGIPFRPLQGEKGTKVVQDFKKDLKTKKDKITINSKKKPEKKELGGTLNINPELLDMFKCGGKSKKKSKKEEGGLIKKKAGIPIKEKFIDKDKCGKKMKKKK